MNFLTKIQKLPEFSRKIILWSIVIIIGLGLAIWWLNYVQQNLKNFQIENLKKHFQLEKKIKNFPKIEMPNLEILKISEEELKKLKEELKKAEETIKEPEDQE